MKEPKQKKPTKLQQAIDYINKWSAAKIESRIVETIVNGTTVQRNAYCAVKDELISNTEIYNIAKHLDEHARAGLFDVIDKKEEFKFLITIRQGSRELLVFLNNEKLYNYSMEYHKNTYERIKRFINNTQTTDDLIIKEISELREMGIVIDPYASTWKDPEKRLGIMKCLRQSYEKACMLE